jgi:hypothetical protein
MLLFFTDAIPSIRTPPVSPRHRMEAEPRIEGHVTLADASTQVDIESETEEEAGCSGTQRRADGHENEKEAGCSGTQRKGDEKRGGKDGRGRSSGRGSGTLFAVNLVLTGNKRRRRRGEGEEVEDDEDRIEGSSPSATCRGPEKPSKDDRGGKGGGRGGKAGSVQGTVRELTTKVT